MDFLLSVWDLWISIPLTILTAYWIYLQIMRKKGDAGHVLRYVGILCVSIFVVYMNIVKATRFPQAHHVLTNAWAWRNKFFHIHQVTGMWYFCALFAILITGLLALFFKSTPTRIIHGWVFAGGLILFWMISTIASTIALFLSLQ